MLEVDEEEDGTPHCEYHNPNQAKNVTSTKKNRKRKRLPSQSVDQEAPNVAVFNQWPRSDIFHEEWKKIDEKIDENLIDLLDDVIDSVLTFIQTETNENNVGFSKIPAAIIILSSPSVRKKMINDLEMKMDENESPTMIELYPFHDSMNSVFQVLFEKIASAKEQASRRCKTVEDILKFLIQDEKRRTLLIVIHDFEKFNMTTLYKLILVLKTFTEVLSTGFIFFKNNLLDANLNNYLPMDVVEYLSVKIIYNDCQKKRILFLLEDIASDSHIRFKFHPNLLDKLVTHLKLVEFSIEYFKNLLRSHLFNHFFFNPLSVICDDTKILNDQNLIDCFKNSLNISENFNEKNDDEYIEYLKNSYQNLLEKNTEFILQLEIFSKLFKYLDLPLENLIVLYSKIYDSSNSVTKENKLSLLFEIGQKTMNQALERINFEFEGLTHPLLTTIAIYQEKLEDLIKKETLEENKRSESIKKLGLESQLEIVKDKLRNINSRSDWRMMMKPAEKRNLSEYEQWKNKFIESLEQLFVEHPLANLKSLVDGLFCNTSVISRVSCRRNLDQALSRQMPDNVLTKLGNVYPSFYILYRFYKDVNNSINLQEWFEEYCQEKKLLEKSSKKEMMALFLNTILDFEHIGLLKCSGQNRFTKIVYL